MAYPDPLSARAYRDILEGLLERTGASVQVRLEGAHGEPVWGVNMRAVQHKGKLLVHLLNLSREPAAVRLVSQRSFKDALNLIDGNRIEFQMTVRPLEPVLIELTPDTD